MTRRRASAKMPTSFQPHPNAGLVMPTYAYRCPACGHEYDKLQKMSDDTRTKCPECDTPGERVISGGAGIVFKGSGFYETDYKRAGEKAPSEPKKETDSKPDKKDKADKKPSKTSKEDSK